MLCIKCHDDKLETDFRKGRKQCKECENKRSREYYKENRVQLLEKVRKPPKVAPTTCTTCNVILNDNNKREGRFRCSECENKRRREEYYGKIKDKINEDRRTKYIKKRPPKTPTKICKYKKNAIMFMDTILNHETLITTLKEKFLRGSRLAAEPDSNNIRE